MVSFMYILLLDQDLSSANGAFCDNAYCKDFYKHEKDEKEQFVSMTQL